MAVSTSIFPLYLDAAPVTVDADDSTYEVVSSRVILDGGASCDLSLDDAAEIGTFVRFECTDSTVDPTVTLRNNEDGASNDVITFATAGDSADCMFFDGGWRVVALNGATVA